MNHYMPILSESMKSQAIKVLSGMPVPCEITIQAYKTKRSQAQNRLYWRWLSDISRNMEVEGEKFSKEEWHHLCAMKWIGVKTIRLNDKEFPMPLKSTTKLKVNEFAEYLTSIEAHFLPKGVPLTFTDDYSNAMGVE